MGKEQEPGPGDQRIRLTGIYVDVPSRTVVFSRGEEIVASLRLASEGLVFDVRRDLLPAPSEPSSTPLPEPVHPMQLPEASSTPVASPTVPEQSETERQKPVTLQGKLTSTPRPGRPDRNEHPTAWARFAVHVEGVESARLYSTTFHRHTAEIALRLQKDMPLTVQGYPHESDDPDSKRMDTLSVINLLEYPGKPPKKGT